MLFTDLNELKAALEIDPGDKSEDKLLSLIARWATDWIAELINRPGFEKKERTEYYGGTGTQQLLLRSRPVFPTPTIQVWLDEQAHFTATSGGFDSTTALTYGVDFVLKQDQDDGTSRCGILINLDQFWPKPSYRERGYLSPYIGPSWGTIKVTYTGGYTLDSLPGDFRLACNLLCARIRYHLPLGMDLNSENYEERSIGILADAKNYLISPEIRRLLMPYRNWRW